ncbi:MAG: hypothetical protein RL681_817 [Candidatus Parcubacteria bacterium]|jgi:hypothetical protein
MHESRPQYFFYAVAFMLFAGLLLLIEVSATRTALETQLAAPIARIPRHPPVAQNLADTASWQTYRNEEYGFEFRYPGDWEINSMVSDVTGEFFVEGRNLDRRIFFVKPMGTPGLEFISSYTTSTAVVGSYSAVRTDYHSTEGPDGVRIVVAGNPRFPNLTIWFSSNNMNHWEEFNSVLSTFKFIK